MLKIALGRNVTRRRFLSQTFAFSALAIREWDALLIKHNVHRYLARHDHDLQHLEFAGHPTSFVISGAGGADLYNLRTSRRNRGPLAQKVFGFSHLEFTREKLILRHLDVNGSVLHAFTKEPNGTTAVLTTAREDH